MLFVRRTLNAYCSLTNSGGKRSRRTALSPKSHSRYDQEAFANGDKPMRQGIISAALLAALACGSALAEIYETTDLSLIHI